MVNVRSLKTDELPLLFQLFDYNDCDDMLAENTRRLNSGEIEIFGLFMGERLIGEIRAAFVHDDKRFAAKNTRAYLFAFRIDEDFQGKGHGQLLLNEVIAVLGERGYSQLTVGVEDDNDPAGHIYRKLGFTHLVGRIREEYQDDEYEYNLYLKTGHEVCL